MFNDLLREIQNIGVFTSSLEDITKNFSVNTLIMMIMMFFTAVGAIDKIRGNKKGYGEKFEEAFQTMGPLAMAMIGVMTLVPLLTLILQPLITPIYELVGASPAMFAGTVLPNDAGAYPLAMQLAESDIASGNFSGLILGSMMGCLFTGLIPFALSILNKEDHPYFAAGVLVALITIPLGCIAGGLVMNITPYKMSISKIMINLIPVITVSILVAVGLWFKPTTIMRGFSAFGKALQVLLTCCTMLAIIQFITGIRLPVAYLMVEPATADGLSPLIESLLVVGTITLVLTGAFPLVHWITKTFQKPLLKLGNKLGLDEVGSAGMVATLASIFPTLNLIKDMNPKGKFLNIAFGVSAGFIFGDHLGFTAGINPDMILPVVIAKLTAAVTALLLANKLAAVLLPRVMESTAQNQAL